MTLYLYHKASRTLLDTLEATGYDGQRALLEDGSILVGEDCELSSRPDLSETLMADWRQAHPTLQQALLHAARLTVQDRLDTLADSDLLKTAPIMDYPDFDSLPETLEQAITPVLTCDGVLYRLVPQQVVRTAYGRPGSPGLLSVYRPLVKGHAGTPGDPIPFQNGMDVEQNQCYSYEGGVWRWTAADTPACVWLPGQEGVHSWRPQP